MSDTPGGSLPGDIELDRIRVLVCSVKPLRPAVTGARLLFDSIAGHFLSAEGSDGFLTVVAVAGPLSKAETASTASIGPAVRVRSAYAPGTASFGPTSGVGRVGAAMRFLAAFVRGRRPVRLRSGWVEAAAEHFAAIAQHHSPAVVIACGQDAATVARLAGLRADVVVLPSLEADAEPSGGGLLGLFDRRARMRCESRAVVDASAVVVSTDHDRIRLIEQGLNDPNRIHVIPHGILIPTDAALPAGDLSAGGATFSSTVPGVVTALVDPAAETTGPEVVIVGSLSYAPNAEAAELACAAVQMARNEVPELVLRVVGSSTDVSARLASAEGVVIVGVVDDLRVEYRRAIGALAPVRSGGGGRIKVLEALANGVPVATTPLGVAGLAVPSIAGRALPIPGIRLTSDGERLVADLAAVIVEWCADPARASDSGRDGQRWVAERFAAPLIGQRWHQLARGLAVRNVQN